MVQIASPWATGCLPSYFQLPRPQATQWFKIKLSAFAVHHECGVQISTLRIHTRPIEAQKLSVRQRPISASLHRNDTRDCRIIWYWLDMSISLRMLATPGSCCRVAFATGLTLWRQLTRVAQRRVWPSRCLDAMPSHRGIGSSQKSCLGGRFPSPAAMLLDAFS